MASPHLFHPQIVNSKSSNSRLVLVQFKHVENVLGRDGLGDIDLNGPRKRIGKISLQCITYHIRYGGKSLQSSEWRGKYCIGSPGARHIGEKEHLVKHNALETAHGPR